MTESQLNTAYGTTNRKIRKRTKRNKKSSPKGVTHLFHHKLRGTIAIGSGYSPLPHNFLIGFVKKLAGHCRHGQPYTPGCDSLTPSCTNHIQIYGFCWVNFNRHSLSMNTGLKRETG